MRNGAGAAKATVQWLVRKAKPLSETGSAPGREEYQILGPYLSDQVRVMIKEQVLEADDEICPENGYWFALHEKDDVQKYLGVDGIQSMPVSPPHRIDDATQPQLEAASVEARTQFVEAPPGELIQQAPAKVRPAANSPEFKERFPRVSIAKSLGYFDNPKSPQILGVEKGKAWSFLFFFLVTGALLGVLWLIRSLRS